MISFSLAWVLVTITKVRKMDVSEYLHDFTITGVCDGIILIVFLFFMSN